MDFVVVGFGLGAVMMLLGFGLRDLGPWLFGTTVSPRSLPEFETVKATIRKQTLASIGNGIATAGTGLALVTLAALLAKTEDELGTIVVGMSLALAAVGVGAWTYDAVRRYRSAMEMVTNQEQAIVARLAPSRPQAAVRSDAPARTSRTLSTRDSVETSSSEEVLDLESEEAQESEEDAPAATANATLPDEYDESALAEPEFQYEPSLMDQESSRASAPENDTRDDTPVEGISPDSQSSSSPDPSNTRPEAAGSPTDAEPERTEPEQPRNDNGGRWTRFTRSDDKRPPVVESDHQFTDLPPLPEEHDDALIEESVRFDSRPEAPRNVPSWLFEDLETDLAQSGNSRQDDPVDHFRSAQPRPRGSALERLLADDEGSESGEEDDQTNDPDVQRSSRRRSEDER